MVCQAFKERTSKAKQNTKGETMKQMIGFMANLTIGSEAIKLAGNLPSGFKEGTQTLLGGSLLGNAASLFKIK